ncbi:hypothetical protein MUK42_27086 [Musa troglodytarum]|uniref:Uncharacterized protein n=1 Tax=Musa troglodytarum TaxID=320322 RepID=A0A9E7K0Y7_9LILI|nr:hypothetical protein MUK42_27086 [Musa troglodytarum]
MRERREDRHTEGPSAHDDQEARVFWVIIITNALSIDRSILKEMEEDNNRGRRRNSIRGVDLVQCLHCTRDDRNMWAINMSTPAIADCTGRNTNITLNNSSSCFEWLKSPLLCISFDWIPVLGIFSATNCWGNSAKIFSEDIVSGFSITSTSLLKSGVALCCYLFQDLIFVY